jgi:hypothetical protein
VLSRAYPAVIGWMTVSALIPPLVVAALGFVVGHAVEVGTHAELMAAGGATLNSALSRPPPTAESAAAYR